MELTKRSIDIDRYKLAEKLQVYVQPIFDLKTLKVVKAEALIRTKETKERIQNNSILALEMIDKYNLHLQLDKFVINEVGKILQSSVINVPIAVNISHKTLEIKNSAAVIIGEIYKYSEYKDQIQLEISENTYFDGEEEKVNLEILNNSNIHLSIDDFGFGDVSMVVISKYNINTVKLDKIFLKDLNSKRVKIIEETIRFLNRLGMDVVIEGIESQVQLDIVRNLGKCCAQGYMLGMPVDVDTYKSMYSKSHH